jgi:hypothetical protein
MQPQTHELRRPNRSGRLPLIMTSSEFVRDFEPPEYLIAGIVQRRFVYSFTGQTGSGKTALMLLIAAHVALGRPIGDREVEKGRALYFAGENPVEVQMRWIAMSQQMDFDVDTIDVGFIAGRFSISELKDHIAAEVEATGDLTLVLVDTSAVYFEGADENDNAQAGSHARLLRSLTGLHGGPCVIVACHPPKNAGADNMQPRGGGSFIAEMDGNLTAKKDGACVELHWQHKFRGPDFVPMTFELRSVTHERLKDRKGRLLPTVIAAHLSDTARDAMAKVQRSQEDDLLKVVAKNPSASHAEMASLLGWHQKDGRPYKMKVTRALDTLAKEKLIKRERSGIVLTSDGKQTLEALAKV